MTSKIIVFVLLLSSFGLAQGVAGDPGVGDSRSAAATTTNFGYTTIGGSTEGNDANYTLCDQITMGANAAGYSVNSISTYTVVGATTGLNLQTAIYTGPTAGTLVCSSTGKAIVNGGWTTDDTISGCGTLAASTSYMVCFSGQAGSWTGAKYDAGSTYPAYYKSGSSYGAWATPNTFGALGNQMSVYITVTPN